MEFDVQPIKEGDYENFLCEWWKDWGWKPPLKDFLPADATGGIVIYDDGVPVCAGFLYVTNSKVSWVDWIVSNKYYRKKPQRQQAMVLLIDTLTNISRNLGNKYVYALIKHLGLIETYQSLGYVKGESYTAEMIKVL
jgi:hypothetical protein